MNLKKVVIDGRAHVLGGRIGKGGEGEIFTLQDESSLALKVYTTHDKHIKEQKVSAMVGLGLSKSTQLVAFPIAIARSAEGTFLGFVMRLVGGHKPLHDLYAPGPRKSHFPHADYRFLVRTATNVAKAVASVHRGGCVIGDINHSSMLVSPKAVVALIDADSFQITSGKNQFLCNVGVPEYTPPELQGKSLDSVVRTPNHDAFGLAIVIFQLLFMGRHPFVGTVRTGEIPPLHENIKNYRYVYAENRNVGMDQPPGTPSISDFSPSIAAGFEAAFSKSISGIRPSAEKWIEILESLESSLVKCDDNDLHYLPKGASECPWCEMEKQLSTILFLPYIPGQDGNFIGRDPGALSFNLDAIWKKIEAISLPKTVHPKLKPLATGVSQNAKLAKPKETSSPNSVFVAIGAIVAFFVVPELFIIWLPLVFWGFSSRKNVTYINSEPFLNAYLEAEKRWNQECDNWNQRLGVQTFTQLKQELLEAKNSYNKLSEEEQSLIQKYHSERRSKQLEAYLDTFDIAKAQIKGIGGAKQAALSSYGIDTAADITKSKLLSVQGFGVTISGTLLAWRDALEKKFPYQASQNDFDRQEIARIKAYVEAKKSALRKKLYAGPVNLETLSQRIQKLLTTEDPALNLANSLRDQAKADLDFLGIPIPARSSSQKLSSNNGYTLTSRPNATASRPNAAPSSHAVTCPRCSSPMVKRLAKRGRNAGSYFWGCSRYPSCKGTRNI
jgi:DNA-binding helix-hairpin-helix protein with protein kinase domain